MDFTADERAQLVHSLSTRGQMAAVERVSVNAARRWALGNSVAGRPDLLTEAFARQLHRRMFGAVWRGAGRYRLTASAEGWSPGDVGPGVRLALEDAEGWIRFGTYSVREAAVRLHHRLMAIRPWSKGNGRHARLMADVVVRSRCERPLSWGAKDGAMAVSPAERYAEAIRLADAGDLSPLVAFACEA